LHFIEWPVLGLQKICGDERERFPRAAQRTGICFQARETRRLKAVEFARPGSVVYEALRYFTES
jgi:hypothetical protein